MMGNVIVACVAVATYSFILGAMVERRWLHDTWLKARWADANHYRMDMARHFYGKRWVQAIKDCDASHLRGTCVLCGGESL